MNKLSLKVFISIFFALISISIFSYNVSADGGEIPVIETPPPTEIVSEETITVVEPLVTQVVEEVFSSTEVSVEITEIPTDSSIATITSEASPVPSESITEVPEEVALGEISESQSDSETITGSLSEADVVLSDENGNALTLATSATLLRVGRRAAAYPLGALSA